MPRTRAAALNPGDTYLHGPDALTVTAPPYTTEGLLGVVLRVPVRTESGGVYDDVVHTDHTVVKTN